MYCVPKDADTSLVGYEGSDVETKMKLVVRKCTPDPGPPGLNSNSTCLGQGDFDDFFDQHGSFRMRMLFVDTIISPSNENPESIALEKDIYLSFS